MQRMMLKEIGQFGSKSFISSGLCRFSASSWNEKDLFRGEISVIPLRQKWWFLWPTFVPWFNDIIRFCVENEKAGGLQQTQLDDSQGHKVAVLIISKFDRKESSDIKSDHAKSSAEPRAQPTSSSQRLALPLPLGMDDEVRLNVGNIAATQPSDAAIRESLCHFYPACLRGTELRRLGQSVCDWCGSYWHNKGILVAKGIDLFFQSGVGAVPSSPRGLRRAWTIRALWRSRPTRSNNAVISW